MEDKRSGRGVKDVPVVPPLDPNIVDSMKREIATGKPRISGPYVCFIRHLDDDGAFEAGVLQHTPQGAVAGPGRDQVLDVEQLLEAIREVVRDEIALH